MASERIRGNASERMRLGGSASALGPRVSFPTRPGGPHVTTEGHVTRARPIAASARNALSSRKSLDRRHLAPEERSKGSRFSDRRRVLLQTLLRRGIGVGDRCDHRMENNGNANNGAQQAAVQLEVGGPVRPFDPASHGLDPGFRLTRFADLKG